MPQSPDHGRTAAKHMSPAPDAARGSKRGKYTSVACEHCKKRKLKCIPAEGFENSCQRCVESCKACVYVPTGRGGHGVSDGKQNAQPVDDIQSLSKKVAALQQEMAQLTETVASLRSRPQEEIDHRTQLHHRDGPKIEAPKEPGFVGPTRSAFSIEIGERSLTRMGIPAYNHVSQSDPQSPVESDKEATTLDVEFWRRSTIDEIRRLVQVFEEEVGVVYPCMECDSLIQQVPDIISWGSNPDNEEIETSPDTSGKGFSLKDFQLAKVAIATAIVTEEQGKNDHSSIMVESVERSVSRILKPTCTLKDLQLIVALSIYYFHTGEDILAWRTIGLAAREALVMGLHQRSTVLQIKNKEERGLATRVFWCIYVLDRRWSFGTSLSFALSDDDLDPELPEPGQDYEYLQCMVHYGRLCTGVWKSMMSAKATATPMPQETVLDYDTKTLAWMESIPPHLRLQHPRHGTAPRPQPVVLQRLRALLYLRGNHTRILIYRHHLLSPTRIKADPRSVWLVVEIAQDVIEVLVHLNATSNIYRRQQSAFNYFLLSALAVVFLAVCHNPTVYAEPCRESFYAAVKLVRDFSRHSKASRRLWDSIKGLLPRLQTLGLRGADDGRGGQISRSTPRSDSILHGQEMNMGQPLSFTHASPHGSNDGQGFNQAVQQGQLPMQNIEGDMEARTDPSGSTPNMFQMSNDLISLFNAIEQGQQFPPDMGMYQGDQMYSDGTLMGEPGEISRRFQGLL